MNAGINDGNAVGNIKNDDWVADVQAEIAAADANSNPATVGRSFIYRVSAHNLSNTDRATGVRIRFIPPANTTVVTSPCSFVGGNYECAAGEVLPGGAANFDFRLTATQPGAITATATIYETTSTEPPNSTGNNTASISTNVIPNVANLAISGTTAPDPIQFGNGFEQIFTVTNIGPNTANNLIVNLQNTVSSRLTTPQNALATIRIGQGAAPNCPITESYSSQFATYTYTANCAASSLANGASAEIKFTATAPASSGILSSVVTASADQAPQRSFRLNLPIRGNADLSLTATAAPNPVLVKQPLEFTFILANGGTTAATNVGFLLPVPAHTIYVPTNNGCQVVAANSLHCSFGRIEPTNPLHPAKVLKFKFEPQTSAIPNIQLPNNPPRITASATVSSADDTNAANNTASASAVVSPAADLTITQNIASVIQATQNAAVIFTVKVRNNGPMRAGGVSLTTDLSGAMTFSGAIESGPGYNCTRLSPNQMRCNIRPTPGLNALNVGEEVTLYLTASVAQSGRYTANSCVTSQTAEPPNTGGNNCAGAVVQITNAAFPADVKINSGNSVPANPREGDIFDLTYNFGNDAAAPNAANDVKLNVSLSPKLRFVSAADSGTISSNVVTFDGGTINPGANIQRTIRVLALEDGTAATNASVTTTNKDTAPANNSHTLTQTVAASPLVDVAAYSYFPNNGEISIAVENVGLDGATGVKLIVESPYPITLQNFSTSYGFFIRNGDHGAPTNCTLSNQNKRLTCDIGNLPSYVCAASPDRDFDDCPRQITTRLAMPEDRTVRVEFNESASDRRPGNHTNIRRSNFNGGYTPTGGNVTTELGIGSVTFGSVSGDGFTRLTPISYNTTGRLPVGYAAQPFDKSYQFSTSAQTASPYTVCFYVPEVQSVANFVRLRVLQSDNSQPPTDRTILAPQSPAPNFATRTICARAQFLQDNDRFTIATVNQSGGSPFAKAGIGVAQISGRVTDSGGSPLADVAVGANGQTDYTTRTDTNGNYTLVNLSSSESYTVQPILAGYSSNPANRVYTNPTIDQTAQDFVLTALPPPSTVEFSAANLTVAENVGNAVLTVIRTGNTSGTATVVYQTTDETAVTGNDFTAANDALVFAPNETTKTVSIPITDDAFNEPAKTFAVNLFSVQDSSQTGAIPIVKVTINDNDALPQISIVNAGLVEGSAGTNFAVFDVSLSAASDQSISAIYTTTAGTAAPGSDYTEMTAIITIPAGAGGGTISIPVFGDTIIELNETFTVSLSAPANAAIFAANAVGTIVNDDFAPTAASVTISGSVLTLTGEGVSQARVTITDTNGASQTILSGKFGRFKFREVAAGGIYILSVGHRRYRFNPQILNVTEDVAGIILRAEN